MRMKGFLFTASALPSESPVGVQYQASLLCLWFLSLFSLFGGKYKVKPILSKIYKTFNKEFVIMKM